MAAAEILSPSRDERGVIGVPVALVRREKAAFIRPLVCTECAGQFIPCRVPAGLPRCPECGG